MSTNASTDTCAEDSTFRPLGVVEERVCRKDRARARTGYVVYKGTTGFEVAIPETVLERIRLFGEKAAPKEWYGILVGRLYDDAAGRHVVVVGAVPDPDADASPGFVRTCFDSELRTRTSASLLYPDGVPVGWVHGHVRFGARYSPTDFRNQATWTQPHSVGIVVDPFTEPGLGVYRGPEGELLELARPEPPAAVAPTADAAVPAGPCAPIEAAASTRSMFGSGGGWPTWLWVAAIVGLALVFGTGYLFGRNGYQESRFASIDQRVAHLEGQQPSPAVSPASSSPDGGGILIGQPDGGEGPPLSVVP